MRIPKAAGAFDQSLAQSDLAFKPSKLEFSPWVQPKPGESDLARQLSKLQFWPWVQPKPGESDLAIQASKLEFGYGFNQSLRWHTEVSPHQINQDLKKNEISKKNINLVG